MQKFPQAVKRAEPLQKKLTLLDPYSDLSAFLYQHKIVIHKWDLEQCFIIQGRLSKLRNVGNKAFMIYSPPFHAAQLRQNVPYQVQFKVFEHRTTMSEYNLELFYK